MALTIPTLFEAAVADVPDKVWLLHEDATFTYREVHLRIGAAASALSQRGVSRGDLVLATARNRPEYVFTWLAAMYLGAIYVAVDPRGTAAELAGAVRQGQPKPGGGAVDAPPADDSV